MSTYKDVPVKITMAGFREIDIPVKTSIQGLITYDVPVKTTFSAQTSKDVPVKTTLYIENVDYGLYGESIWEAAPRETFFYAQGGTPDKSVAVTDPYWFIKSGTTETGKEGHFEIGFGQNDDHDETDANLTAFIRAQLDATSGEGEIKIKPSLWFYPGAEPTTEQEGMMYYDSSAHDYMYYDGTSWELVGGGAAGGLTGSGTQHVIPKWTTTSSIGDSIISQDSGGTALTIGGTTTISTINAGAADYDKFLVSDSGLVKFRTGAEVLSDIDAASSSHGSSDHSGAIFAGANDDFGAFYLDIGEIAAPTTPASNVRRLFVNTATNEISVVTDGGSTVSLESAGGGPGSGTQWNLPVWDTTSTLGDSMVSQDAASTTATKFKMYRQSTSIGAGMHLQFQLQELGPALRTYAQISGVIVDNTASSIDGEMQFWVADDDTITERMVLDESGNLQFDGTLTASTINAGASDYDKFLVSDSGVVKFRTGAEVYSDIDGYVTADFTTDFAAEDLNNLATKSHDNLDDVSVDDHHSETHVLAVTGPHTGTLPLADLAVGSQGSIIYRDVTDWAELTLGTSTYVLKSGATDVAWGQVGWSELSGRNTGTADRLIKWSSGGTDYEDVTNLSENAGVLTFTGMFLDINSSGIGTNTVIDLTHSSAVSAGATWKAFHIDGAALDPAAGAVSSIYAHQIELQGVLQTNNPNMWGLDIQMPATYGTGTVYALSATGDGNTVYLCDGSYAISATGSIDVSVNVAAGGNVTSGADVTAVGDVIAPEFYIGADTTSPKLANNADALELYSGSTPALALTLDTSQDAAFVGDVQVGGNDIKDSGGNVIFTFDGSGALTKVGDDTPGTDEFLQWNGTKAVWGTGAVGGTGTQYAIPRWATTTSIGDSSLIEDSGSTTLAGTYTSVSFDSGSNTANIIYEIEGQEAHLDLNTDPSVAANQLAAINWQTAATDVWRLGLSFGYNQFILSYEPSSVDVFKMRYNSGVEVNWYVDLFMEADLYFGSSASFPKISNDSNALGLYSGTTPTLALTLATDQSATLVGPLTISTINAGVADYDKFLVSHTGLLKFRTGAEAYSDMDGYVTADFTTDFAAESFSNLGTRTHVLDGADHTVSGLTGGHFLKADTATTYSFQAHGLTASDVGAAATLSGTQWALPVFDTTSTIGDSMISQSAATGDVYVTLGGDFQVRDADDSDVVLLKLQTDAARMLTIGPTMNDAVNVTINGTLLMYDDGISIYKQNSDGGTSYYARHAAALGGGNTWRSFYSLGDLADPEGASATMVGLEVDYTGTLMTNNPNLYGVRAQLPATYGSGTEYAGYFTGDGKTVAICDDTYSIDATGEVRLNTINAAVADHDKFLVSDTGVIEFRTGAEAYSDMDGYVTADFTTDFAAESLANLTTRTHASLSDAPADAHHVAFVLSDFTTAFAAESLANLATRAHSDLSDAPTDAHHNEAHVLAVTGPHTGTLPLADLAVGAQGSIIYRDVTDWAELTLGTNTYVLKSGATDVAWGQVDYSELVGTQPAPVAHVLATTGPHSGTLPLTDLAAGTQGSVIIRGAADWEELSLGTNTYVLKSGATDVSWSTVDWGELTGTQPAPVSHALSSHTQGDNKVFMTKGSAFTEIALGTATYLLTSGGDGADLTWTDPSTIGGGGGVTGSGTNNQIVKWLAQGVTIQDSIIADDGSTATIAGNLTVGTYTKVQGDYIQIYETVNDGNPYIQIGSSTTNDFFIQTLFNSGTQVLDYAKFISRSASATADDGRMEFYPDSTLALTIHTATHATLPSGVTIAGSVVINAPYLTIGDGTAEYTYLRHYNSTGSCYAGLAYATNDHVTGSVTGDFVISSRTSAGILLSADASYAQKHFYIAETGAISTTSSLNVGTSFACGSNNFDIDTSGNITDCGTIAATTVNCSSLVSSGHVYCGDGDYFYVRSATADTYLYNPGDRIKMVVHDYLEIKPDNDDYGILIRDSGSDSYYINLKNVNGACYIGDTTAALASMIKLDGTSTTLPGSLYVGSHITLANSMDILVATSNVSNLGSSTSSKFNTIYVSNIETGDVHFANGFLLREVQNPSWDGDKDASDEEMWAWTKDDGVTPGLEFHNNKGEMIALLDEDGDFHVRGKLHECSDIFN